MMLSDAMLIETLSEQEKQHIASWAAKTSRTEEWTGSQVIRLLSVPDTSFKATSEEELLQQAKEELNHARLYAHFAQQFQEPEWIGHYARSRQNFYNASFTLLLRNMDQIPVSHHLSSLIRFLTGLFFLDLAGLMTVNVYEESPFSELQNIALQIRSDEGKHVHDTREWLLSLSESLPNGKKIRVQAVKEFLPAIDAFFGNDDSPVQRTLHKVGIRKTKNAELKRKFREKIHVLLRIE